MKSYTAWDWCDEELDRMGLVCGPGWVMWWSYYDSPYHPTMHLTTGLNL